MGKKVLVAEADSTVQQVVSYFLGLEGFEVTTAGDGVAALEAVERLLPEVILLDPDLAAINGVEVSRLIHEKSQFKNIPILFLVGSKDSLSKMDKEIPTGYGVIHKPIDPTRMVNTIKEYMEKAPPAAIEKGESVRIEELLGWEVSAISEKPEGLPFPEDELGGLFVKREITEEATVEEVPGGVEANLRGRISDEMIESMISKIARDTIERVAWEVAPKIAEEEIRREIERLKSGDE